MRWRILLALGVFICLLFGLFIARAMHNEYYGGSKRTFTVSADTVPSPKTVRTWLCLNSPSPKVKELADFHPPKPAVEAHLEHDLVSCILTDIGNHFPQSPADLYAWFPDPSDDENAYPVFRSAANLYYGPDPWPQNPTQPTNTELRVMKNYVDRNAAFRKAIAHAVDLGKLRPPFNLNYADPTTLDLVYAFQAINKNVRFASRLAAVEALCDLSDGHSENAARRLVFGWRVLDLANQNPDFLRYLTSQACATLLLDTSRLVFRASSTDTAGLTALGASLRHANLQSAFTRSVIWDTVTSGSSPKNAAMYRVALSFTAADRATIDSLLVAIAVQRYRMAKSRLPDTLDALVPQYLEAVPKDPYTGKPLQYRKFNKGYAVFSVGPNDIDPNTITIKSPDLDLYGIAVQ